MGAGPAPPPRPPQTGRPAPAPASLRARRERNGAPRASRFINDFLVTISQTASYADTWILQNLFTLPFFFSPVKIHTHRHAHSCEQTALRVKSTLLSGPRERLLSAARWAFFPSGPLSIRRCREAAFSTPTRARPLPAVPAERAVTALV